MKMLIGQSILAFCVFYVTIVLGGPAIDSLDNLNELCAQCGNGTGTLDSNVGNMFLENAVQNDKENDSSDESDESDEKKNPIEDDSLEGADDDVVDAIKETYPNDYTKNNVTESAPEQQVVMVQQENPSNGGTEAQNQPTAIIVTGQNLTPEQQQQVQQQQPSDQEIVDKANEMMQADQTGSASSNVLTIVESPTEAMKGIIEPVNLTVAGNDCEQLDPSQLLISSENQNMLGGDGDTIFLGTDGPEVPMPDVMVPEVPAPVVPVPVVPLVQ